jgi:hypothetical protein
MECSDDSRHLVSVRICLVSTDYIASVWIYVYQICGRGYRVFGIIQTYLICSNKLFAPQKTIRVEAAEEIVERQASYTRRG